MIEDRMIDEQKFWEKCGFRLGYCQSGSPCYGHWHNPNGEWIMNLPSITDLNALFRWAVPVLQQKGCCISLVALECSRFDCHVAKVFTDEPMLTIGNDNPALALAEAIWKVMEGE